MRRIRAADAAALPPQNSERSGEFPQGGFIPPEDVRSSGVPRRDGTTVVWSVEDPHETYALNGVTYLITMGRYREWADFQSMMDGLFTPEYQRTPLHLGESYPPNFAFTEDGLLCFQDAQRGSDLEYDWSDTPDSFVLVGHYAILDYGDADDDVPVVVGEYTREYPIRLEKTGLGWRVAEIHLPY